MNATLRDGASADVAELMVSMTDAFEPCYGEAWTAAQCTGVLGLPGVRLLLARLGAEPVGFALARSYADEAELLLLAVRPRFRHAGIGRALLAATMAAADSAGAARIFLEMREGNPAGALYLRSGFAEVGRRPRYYRGADGAFFDALTFSRPIGASGFSRA